MEKPTFEIFSDLSLAVGITFMFSALISSIVFITVNFLY